MIRLCLLVMALSPFVPIQPPSPPPGVGSCPVRGEVTLPCAIADYYYAIAEFIRTFPIKV